MNFAILRIAKLKTAQNIAGSAHHCFRSRETLNADPARADKNQFFGARSAAAVRQAVEQRLAGLKVRKNAVMCVEYMITVSPEVFERDPQLVTRYLRDAHKWLIAQHGAENVIGGGIHYDEKTPHLSAYVVPIDPKGKLNASHFFDGREKLSDFQTRFWEVVGKPHGLNRGIEGSTAKHTTLKQYYSALKADSPAVLVNAADTEPRVTEKRLFRDKKENPEQVSKRINATVEKKIKPLKARAKKAELDAQAHAARVADLERLRAESARLREIELDAVFERMGATRDPDDRKNWRVGNSRISTNGQKWYDHANAKGGGGAIDLVMHVEQLGYPAALQWLAHEFGATATESAALLQQRNRVRHVIEQPPAPFAPPAPVPGLWSRVKTYLTKTRCIAASIVEDLHNRGQIYADKFANAVFKLGADEGVELRGTTEQPFHRTRGKKALFEIVTADKKTAVFVESPIDAMSFVDLLKFQGRVISVGGNNEQRMLQRAAELRAQQFEIIGAFDNDETGERLSTLLGAPRLTPPGGAKDWNDALKSARKTPPPGGVAELIGELKTSRAGESGRPRPSP